jgi:hypothetical protein
MPATYEKIATTTLTGTSSTIDFTSISSAYTDLRLVLTYTSTAAFALTRLRFNSNTSALYSNTTIFGDGSTVDGNNYTGQTNIAIDTYGTSTTRPTLITIDLFSYTNATNKTVLLTASEDQSGSGQVTRAVGLFRSSAAITEINLFTTSSTYAAGTTATLYGILKA